jgi:hypothetical protein
MVHLVTKDSSLPAQDGVSERNNLDFRSVGQYSIAKSHPRDRWRHVFKQAIGCHFSPRLVFAQDNYFRIDRHYLDKGQFGFVPIDAPFSYVQGDGGETENSSTYNVEKLSARLNLFAAREEESGVASGHYNFAPGELSYVDRHYFVFDHTPLVGASGGIAYRWNGYQFSLDGLFSSGLRGGFANQTQLPKVWQFNLGVARDFIVPRLGKFTNRIILVNIFDRTNLIRPASGIGVFQAASGPRITACDALTVPLPSL